MKRFFFLLLVGMFPPVVAAQSSLIPDIFLADSTLQNDSTSLIDSSLLKSQENSTKVIRSPLTNQSLLVGNSYFTELDKGDGAVRWAEGRLLFGRYKDYHLLSGGVFVNVVEVACKISDYLYYDREIAFGPAINFGSQKWSKTHEIWGWMNAGLKFGFDKGQVGQYNTKQKDKSFYLFGGILFKNSSNLGPFYIDKIMVTYQKYLEGNRESSYGLTELSEPSVDKSYLKVAGENIFCSLPLNKKGTLRFEPKIIGSVMHQVDGDRLYYTTGLGFSLTRKYSQEIATVQAEVKFSKNIPEVYSVGLMLNIAEVWRALK